jgi:hypothetical protein
MEIIIKKKAAVVIIYQKKETLIKKLLQKTKRDIHCDEATELKGNIYSSIVRVGHFNVLLSMNE